MANIVNLAKIVFLAVLFGFSFSQAASESAVNVCANVVCSQSGSPPAGTPIISATGSLNRTSATTVSFSFSVGGLVPSRIYNFSLAALGCFGNVIATGMADLSGKISVKASNIYCPNLVGNSAGRTLVKEAATGKLIYSGRASKTDANAWAGSKSNI